MSAYDGLTRGELEQRLRMAEDVCVLFGWCGVGADPAGDAAEAVNELWQQWARLVGSEFTGPDAHPDLVRCEAALAGRRRETRRETLAYFFGPEAGTETAPTTEGG